MVFAFHIWFLPSVNDTIIKPGAKEKAKEKSFSFSQSLGGGFYTMGIHHRKGVPDMANGTQYSFQRIEKEIFISPRRRKQCW